MVRLISKRLRLLLWCIQHGKMVERIRKRPPSSLCMSMCSFTFAYECISNSSVKCNECGHFSHSYIYVIIYNCVSAQYHAEPRLSMNRLWTGVKTSVYLRWPQNFCTKLLYSMEWMDYHVLVQYILQKALGHLKKVCV